MQRLDDVEREKGNINDSASKLVTVLENLNGDVNPTRRKIGKLEERFGFLREDLTKRLKDLLKKKAILERLVKCVDEANEWSVKTNEIFSKMVTNKPEIKELKQELQVIQVSR